MSSPQCQWYQFMRGRTSIKSRRRWQMSRNVHHRVHVRIEALAAHPAIDQLDTHLRSADVAPADRIHFMVLLQSITRWPARGNRPGLSTDSVIRGQTVLRAASADGRVLGADSGLCLPDCGFFSWYRGTTLCLLWSVHHVRVTPQSRWKTIYSGGFKCDYLTNYINFRGITGRMNTGF